MSTIQLKLSEDLDSVGRLDALNGIREALWGIHPRNILRSIVEEVAGESPDDEEEDEDYSFSATGRKNKPELEHNSINIEVVDGLTLAVKYGYNRRSRLFGAVVQSMTMELNGKVFVLDEMFALETNVEVLQGDPNQTFSEFVDIHQRLADESPVTGNEEQIDILIDLLFDFTPIESVW